MGIKWNRTKRRSPWLALAIVLGVSGAAVADTASQIYARNKMRLDRMSPEERRQTWEKYRSFLALPDSEQRRIRQLDADLKRQPLERRERYRNMIARFRKWHDDLPLTDRQKLEDAVPAGHEKMFDAFSYVQSRVAESDKMRPYWLLPESREMRTFVQKVIEKLSASEVEALDQLPPRERIQQIAAAGLRLGIDPPPIIARGPNARNQLFGGLGELLPLTDSERFLKFVATLPKELQDDLVELKGRGPRQQRILREYYQKHPDELEERRRAMRQPPGSGATDRPPPNDRPPGERPDRPKGQDGRKPGP